MNLVAIQQKQLLALEAEVAERQRALQENMLRLKLLTTPMLQAWAEVTAEGLGDLRSGGRRYYLKLFQNKQLVCWTDSIEAARNSPPARVSLPLSQAVAPAESLAPSQEAAADRLLVIHC